jgi:hypothetical protein
MSSALLNAETDVAVPVEAGPGESPRERRPRAGDSGKQRLFGSLVYVSVTLVLVAVLVGQIADPPVPSLVLRRVLVILAALVGWLICFWRGFRYDGARRVTRDWV